MKVLLINGSPNVKGCTNRALREIKDELIKEGIDAEIFWIGNKPIGGCMACGQCRNNDGCIINDKVNEFVELAKGCDAFVFGSPVYYAGCAGNMKSFLDRAFYSGGKYLRGKLGAAVASSRRGGSTSVFDEINKFFTISEMPVVSSCYWNEVHGSNAEQVEQDQEGLYTMKVLARNMAYLLKCIDAGKKAGIEKEDVGPRVWTNFVR
ncbi:MAG: flavodoxin family protein [Bacilli bacterium]|nr:flavodoxin family protein [Bacilli bacterium]